MPLRISLIFLFISFLLISACKSSRKAGSKKYVPKTSTSRSNAPSTRQDYIDEYSDIAIREMNRSGIPASITLAQAVLESGNGNSTLARSSNNHFGIKCHSDWKGKTFTWDDDKKNECFRKYNSVEESFRDHTDFLKNKSRYAFLFELDQNDYKGWSKGLKKAGYATNPKYAQLLIDIIETNDLTIYDTGKAPKKKEKIVVPVQSAVLPTFSEAAPPSSSSTSTVPDKKTQTESTFYTESEGGFVVHTGGSIRQIKRINKVDYIVTRSGDTFESLAEEYQLLKVEVIKYNELSEDIVLQPGMVIYLQPKRNQAEKGIIFHIAGDNETMRDIGQKYAIKSRKLYEMNEMKKGQNPSSGQKIRLREE